MKNREYKFTLNTEQKKGRSIVQWMVILAVGVIAAGAVIAGIYFFRSGNDGAADVVYEAMADSAALPVIQMQWNGQQINSLYGRNEEIQPVVTRESTSPLSEDRKLVFQIEPNQAEVTGISYRVRSMSTGKLIEDGKIKKWETEEDTGILRAEIAFSSLIQENQEYRLEISLKTKDRGQIYYDTRIYCCPQENITQLVTFAEQFSAATFDKEQAESILVPYILTGQPRDNQDLSHVDLYNKFSALTWGTLSPVIEGAIETTIYELSETQVSLGLRYSIRTEEENGGSSVFDVNEFFCVRVRSGNIYILDYAKDMREQFLAADEDIHENAVYLGTGEDYSKVINSEKGTYLSFVKDDQVWLLDTKQKKMQRVFGWSSAVDDRYQVRLIRASEEGSLEFLVYGYIPQGEFEGSCQIQCYRYNAQEHHLDMLFYVPIEEYGPLLEDAFGHAAYINDAGKCYLMYGSVLYEISLDTNTVTVVQEGLQKGHYQVNEAGNRMAWETGEDLSVPEAIYELDMETGEIRTIEAEEDCYAVLFGFVETDLVYGTNTTEAIGTYTDGSRAVPYQKVYVIDSQGEAVREYDGGDNAVLSVETHNSYIALTLGREEDGIYRETGKEKLLSGQKVTEGTYAVISQKTTGQKLTEAVLEGTASMGFDSYAVSRSLPLLSSAGKKQLDITPKSDREEGYYAFREGRLVQSANTMAEAIRLVFDAAGTVTDDSMQVCWNRDSRALYVNLNINEKKAETPEDTLAVCMEILLENQGVYQSKIEDRLEKGKTVREILEKELDGRMLDLKGCEVSWLLYYINAGSPVLAVTGEKEAVLIVGYDTNHVVLYDGIQNKYAMTIEEAESYFSERGSDFISYLPGE